MTDRLTSDRKGPPQADSAVIFLHGYGADGADLLGLADPLAPHLPRTAFFAPNAPEPCRNNPMGYQWFPIPWLDGSSEADARSSMIRSVGLLDAYLDSVLAAEGLTPDRLVLVGFSQGTMMALHVAPRRDKAVAGIVGFSGRLLAPETLAAEARVKPPVLLIHGDEDQMVPFEDMGLAGNALMAAGFTVYGHVMKGTGHGISPDGLSVALAFIRDRLSA
ncbi:dienelactone hydrolase family protein [Paracoccus bogoriensis]|uniref:alpha/beta hydrolase n=1 Tax=Paracoccus bogoriensis TaxID=242065 RepID=UPI001CA551FC|nr:alpha/beta fold hydrolase [Paracoccus bogoriensis]MBW7055947.1 dienelactone hydrolase family protein [Paracoccus bogoriensis]